MIKIIFYLLFLSSCSYFTKNIDNSYFEEINSNGKKDELQILFSHNIDGETHPCGCRKYPLGGLSQIAGEMYEIRESFPTIYVDTGDAFFPSPNIPPMVEKSLKFKAKEIAQALKKLGLMYYVPGDQDFALGEDFLNELLTENNISVLVSNFKATTKIKHQKWSVVKFGDQHLFFIGVINTEFRGSDISSLLSDPEKGIKDSLTEIEKKYSDLKNKKIILLSHSGIDKDEYYAEKFPQLNWIIGAHSQSFLRNYVNVGNVKIAQTKSRNHYLGKISISGNLKEKDKYELIEVRDFLANKWKDNPYIPWLIQHKQKLEKIQLEEQGELVTDNTNMKIRTVSSCIDCHTAQTDFWKASAHAISYYTLVQNNEQHNTNCIGCHSLEYKNPKAFISTKQVVTFENSEKSHEEKFNNYLAELKNNFKGINSIRKLSAKKRKSLANKWQDLDQKYKVEHNFANVQCLNCHIQSNDHPFDDDKKLNVNYESQCIKCHTEDQSPEWYNKDEKGVASGPNKEYFAKKLKSIACPKNNNE